AQGKIHTVAGNSSNGNTGDGGPANYATMASPGGAAVDAQGNIYISDTSYHRIRRVTTDGKINHFAGSATGIAGSIGDNGQAVQARFNRPTALVIDAQNNLYFADSGNHRVRAINLSTGIINTVAGNGGAGYSGDGVPASTASLYNPTGIAVDAQGNLYIADRNNQRIRRVDAATQQITTIAGNGASGFGGDNGQATAAQLNNPNEVAVDLLGNVYIVDQTNNRIRRVNATGIIETIAGTGVNGFSGDGGPALQAHISTPTGIEVESDGSIYFGDSGNLRVRKLAPSGPPPPPPPPVNRNPVITSAISNQTLTKGQVVDLPLAATDEDGDSVTFTLVGAPAFASITNANAAARTATLHLAPTAAGVFTGLQVKADDGKGGTALAAAFSVTVNEPVNQCIAIVPASQWKGEYFNNRNLAGSPLMIRADGDGSLNLPFGTNSPSTACGLPADNFSARFSRDVTFQGGVYRFSAFADDGVRLFIDGQLKIDKWIDQAETRYDVDVTLSAGTHTLRMDYYENGGGAVARLFWNALNYFPVVNNIPNQTVTRGQIVDVSIIASDSDNDPVKLTLDNAPAFATLINADTAARKATLRIAPPASGTDAQFTLTIKADDGRGGQGTSNAFTITVTNAPPPPANRPPVANAKALPSTIEAPDDSGATITLDGSASSDPDGDTLSYSWADLGTVIATQAVTDIKLPVGTHVIGLTVNDGKGGISSTAAQTVTINAPAPAPSNPTILSLLPSSGKRGLITTVSISGSGFMPGSTVSISGSGILTSTTYLNPNQLNVRVTISSNAFTTVRNVTVVNPNGTSATKISAFYVNQ
ncbi:MAG: PA14 domain-containing protein, partial [Acidobacteriota bacterium]|nr:PA14 domain-containing protein [Acidobacteriota bacterium]